MVKMPPSYSADISPPIFSVRVFAVESPSPVDFLASLTAQNFIQHFVYMNIIVNDKNMFQIFLLRMMYLTPVRIILHNFLRGEELSKHNIRFGTEAKCG